MQTLTEPAATTVLAVAERTSSPMAVQQTFVYHLPAPGVVEGCDGECTWHEVVCGGGITMPGGFEQVDVESVCPDCLAGRVTMLEPSRKPKRRRRAVANTES